MGSGKSESNTREEWLQIIWPETGLHTIAAAPSVPRDTLDDDAEITLSVDFLTLSLSPLEFIQLASFLRMSVDQLLERHPGWQKAVVNAFDVKD